MILLKLIALLICLWNSHDISLGTTEAHEQTFSWDVYNLGAYIKARALRSSSVI